MTRKLALFAAVMMLCFTGYAQESHKVKKGDTLWDISGKYYSDFWKWPVIWKSNVFINNPDLIYPNQELEIPYIKGGKMFKLGGADKIVKLEGSKYGTVDSDAEDMQETASDYESPYDAGVADLYYLNDYEMIRFEDFANKVVGFEKDKFFVSVNDAFIIDLGEKNGIKRGDPVTIYSKVKDLKDKYVFKVVGYGEVTRVEGETSFAVLKKAFDSIDTDKFITIAAPKELTSPKGYIADTAPESGRVVYLNDDNTMSGAGERFIFDAGVEKGFDNGDIVKVLRTKVVNNVQNVQVIAEAVIVNAERGFSTAKLIKNNEELKLGDYVYIQKSAVF